MFWKADMQLAAKGFLSLKNKRKASQQVMWHCAASVELHSCQLECGSAAEELSYPVHHFSFLAPSAGSLGGLKERMPTTQGWNPLSP